MIIICVFLEDELVSLDELQEKIQEFEDYVQSTDVAAMQSTYRLGPYHRRHLLIISRRAVRRPPLRLLRGCS